MTAPLTEEEMAFLEGYHAPHPWRAHCYECGDQLVPCTTARLLVELRALRAERDKHPLSAQRATGMLTAPWRKAWGTTYPTPRMEQGYCPDCERKLKNLTGLKTHWTWIHGERYHAPVQPEMPYEELGPLGKALRDALREVSNP